MKINGFNLPIHLSEAITKKSFYRKMGSWQLKSNTDSFQNHLETELGEVYDSLVRMEKETRDLSKYFKIDEDYAVTSENSSEPGYIEDITNFTKVVCFGISGDGSPFCLDYRKSEKAPCIIWWDDIYWRKISPNFDEFIKLFDGDFL